MAVRKLSDFEVEIFIQLWHDEPCLWDVSQRSYSEFNDVHVNVQNGAKITKKFFWGLYPQTRIKREEEGNGREGEGNEKLNTAKYINA